MDAIEIKIIKKCQAGDLGRFGELYDKYIRKIYDFIFYKTHHKETAEDLTSKTFMKALKNINRFDIFKGTFQAWIYQVARNTVIDHYRTKKVDANIEDAWDLSGTDDIERDIDVRDKLKQVREYLIKLEPEHRNIIIMRVWQGMSHGEIAEVLGKTEASIKMKFSRGMRRLRKDVPISTLVAILMIGQ